MTDNVSYDLVRGATVDYVQELIKSTFEVSQGLQQPFLSLPTDESRPKALDSNTHSICRVYEV